MTLFLPWMAGLFGGTLQTLGLLSLFTPWALLESGSAELDALLAFCIWAIGLPFLTGALESILHRRGRSPLWALASLSGPPGALVLLFLPQRTGQPREIPVPPGPQKIDRIAAWILTLGGFAFLIFAAVVWMSREDPYVYPDPDPRTMRANEEAALLNMKRISHAQEVYHQTDWNEDGCTSYAMFLVHLWGTLDGHSDPVPSRLIPRELGFAMAASNPIDGYFFVDLHERSNAEDPGSGTATDRLDPEKEWAVMALPAAYGRTGSTAFLVTQKGTIFAKDAAIESGTLLPRDPAAMGWKSLGRVEDARWEGETR